MAKKDQSQTASQNHKRVPPEEREAEALKQAQRLCDALNYALQSTRYSNPEMNQILRHGEVYPGVGGLEMDVAAIGFPKTETDDGEALVYTWEFIEGKSAEELAQVIIEQVREAQEEGTIPHTAGEFLTDQDENIQ